MCRLHLYKNKWPRTSQKSWILSFYYRVQIMCWVILMSGLKPYDCWLWFDYLSVHVCRTCTQGHVQSCLALSSLMCPGLFLRGWKASEYVASTWMAPMEPHHWAQWIWWIYSDGIERNLVNINATLKAQCYVVKILEPLMLPIIQYHPFLIILYYCASHTALVSVKRTDLRL